MSNLTNDRRLTYSRAELARATGLCEKTIANHETPRGSLRFIKIGPRGKRYLATDVDVWLASLRCDAEGGAKQ